MLSRNAWKTIQRGGHDVELEFQTVVEENEYGKRYADSTLTVTAIQNQTQNGAMERTPRESSPNSVRVYFIAVTDETDTPIPIRGGGGDSATVVHDTDIEWVVTDYDALENGVYRLTTRRVT